MVHVIKLLVAELIRRQFSLLCSYPDFLSVFFMHVGVLMRVCVAVAWFCGRFVIRTCTKYAIVFGGRDGLIDGLERKRWRGSERMWEVLIGWIGGWRGFFQMLDSVGIGRKCIHTVFSPGVCVVRFFLVEGAFEAESHRHTRLPSRFKGFVSIRHRSFSSFLFRRFI